MLGCRGLARWGVVAGPELVRALMRAAPGGLPATAVAAAHHIAGSGRAGPGLVNQDFSAEVPGQKMVGDITYIPTWQGWSTTVLSLVGKRR